MKNKKNTSVSLNKPEYYLNRELSALAFNQRVLALAKNNSIPLLERLRFLFICSSNLDEFFEIRVAGLKERIAIGSQKSGPDGFEPAQLLNKISQQAHALIAEIYSVLNHALLPALFEHEFTWISPKQWSPTIKAWVEKYFHLQILPVLSPIGLDLAHPFPRLVNKSLNFVVTLEGKDAFGRDSGLAIVHAPRSLARVIKIPDSIMPTGDHFVLLTSMIEAHASSLFPGMAVTGCYQFRLTRNSDLFVDEEAAEDLALALKTELFSRHYGHAVRLEIADDCPKTVTDYLLDKHHLNDADCYYCPGPVNLSRYMQVLDLVNKPELRYPSFTPRLPTRLDEKLHYFDAIAQHDILLHHPYQSFDVVIHFIRQATNDPNVLAIKQTLYRTHAQSAMVKALIDAARAGIEVTAVIELRARFDEASNIELANRLQEAGALVVYGIMGYKTHAKLTLVVRREGSMIRRYAHLGTGNYHERTARQYTDIGLLTYNAAITRDVQNIFVQLTGMGKTAALSKLWHSPFTLKKQLSTYIQKEVKQAQAGKRAMIILKVNGLTCPKIITKLYQASQAGVEIHLIVRSICCLLPGIKNISDNITVHCVLGRFLEHHRVYYFYNDGKETTLCASADLMERNLYHRVEVAFPIEDVQLKERIKNECLLNYIQSKTNWHLDNKGYYHKGKSRGKNTDCPQNKLLNYFMKNDH